MPGHTHCPADSPRTPTQPAGSHPKSLNPRPRNTRALPAARPHKTKPRRAGCDRTLMYYSGQPRFHHPSLSPRDENRWNTEMKTDSSFVHSFIGPCAERRLERLVPWPSSPLPSSGLRHSQSSHQSCRNSHSAETCCGPPRLSRPP